MISYGKSKFSIARLGNIFGSNGSVVELFTNQFDRVLTITDGEMTRYTISIDECINVIFNCLIDMKGGEIYIPELKKYKVMQLATIINNNNSIYKVIGKRIGERMHEQLINDTETEHIAYSGNDYIKIDKTAISIKIDKSVLNKYVSSEFTQDITDDELKTCYDNYQSNIKN